MTANADSKTGNKNQSAALGEEGKKKKFFLFRLWKYFNTYEKIWLFTLCAIGISLAIVQSEDARLWLRVFEVITVFGGCLCELLLSKQSKWAFIVSFFFFDLTQTVVYAANGYYVSVLTELVFWMPLLFISFFKWDKRQDREQKELTVVKKINFKRDLSMFVVVLAASLAIGGLLTVIEGSEIWWFDAIKSSFGVMNGILLIMRLREQWIAWLIFCIMEVAMWIYAGAWVMLVLSIGYLTNSIYGLFKWSLYIKKHKDDKENSCEKEPAKKSA